MALAIVPVLCFAQGEATLKKNYAEDVHNMIPPLKWDDKTNIIAINGDQKDITVSAISADMQEAWSIKVPGYAISISRLKAKC